MQIVKQAPYSALAEIYDAVMQNVGYEMWADFIDEIIQVHHPHPETVLELACGTASLSICLAQLGCYRISATDKSAAMIHKAREKARDSGVSLQLKTMDFLHIDMDERFDIIVSIFDSINYLKTPDEIKEMLQQVRQLMDAQSLFIFDFTTPENSRQAVSYLNDGKGKTANNYHYTQKSRYDPEQQIHYNIFDIEKLASDQQTVLEHVIEEHRQRIYSLQEMRSIIADTDFRIVAQYGEFDLDPATDKNLRITMVLQCPNIP